jgi:hypothetical protein
LFAGVPPAEGSLAYRASDIAIGYLLFALVFALFARFRNADRNDMLAH